MKSQSLTFERILTSSADTAWSVLSRVDAVAEWAPIIASCRVQTEGDVTTRICTTVDGGILRECIIEVNAAERSLDYSVDEGLPIDSYQGRTRVAERGNLAVLVWTIDIAGEEVAVAQVARMLDQVAAPMLAGLDRLATGSVAEGLR